MSVKKASVVAAVSYLQKNEFIKHERYGFITLTEQGRVIASNVDRKNSVVYEFLSGLLKIEPEKAKNEACLIEHSLSDETASKLAGYIKSNRQTSVKKIGKKVRK